MNIKYVGFFIICIILATAVSSAVGRTLSVNRGSDFQATINFAQDGDTIIVGEKELSATPRSFVDSLCGNCTEHRTPVQATYGFIIKDKSLYIIGLDRANSVLRTNAGYGLLIINSPFTCLSNFTIKGGRRDPDGNATDAAIVIRNSKVYIHDLNIIDNDHRVDSLDVGIAGIIGREGAEIFINNCHIINNGWDGVALYRGALATISDCVIKDGRGAGIGVTWDATCFAYRNRISGYWKGIGAFGTSWVMAHNNAVFDNLGWGIVATGQAYMDIANNVVYHNGNCGIAPWGNDCHGRIVNNIISENGWKEFWVCPLCGIWNNGDWAKWEYSHNIAWNNNETDYKNIWDQTDINGNLSQDPLFMADDNLFNLKENSPAINSGNPYISDIDGTRSDIGLHGGPQGKK